jgi:hypothetical protein
MGKFCGEVFYDIIPVYMVSCHFLLGKPWYDEDHTNKYYKYVVRCGRVEYSLHSMDVLLFKNQRDEIIQQFKENEERMNEAATKN